MEYCQADYEEDVIRERKKEAKFEKESLCSFRGKDCNTCTDVDDHNSPCIYSKNNKMKGR